MKKRSLELDPSTGGKRSRCEDFEPSESDSKALTTLEEEDLIFNETLVALQMMRAQFPRIEKVSIQPFILQTQLYSSLKDRTQVDRELESLRRDGVLRVFKLNTGQDDHAVMFIDDYINQIDVVVKKMDEKKQSDRLHVFSSFKTHVLRSKLDTSISHDELCSLLRLGGKVTEGDVSQLLNAGVLIRRLIDPNTYWFSIPNIGPVLKGLARGRNEVVSTIKRRKYKEIPLSLLETKRLRYSILDVRFHLRDLMGSGHLKVVATPTGLVVRVAAD